MPVTVQDWIVYALVLAVVWWLLRRLAGSLRSRGGGCGGGCKCARDTVRRNPVIRRYLKKREREEHRRS